MAAILIDAVHPQVIESPTPSMEVRIDDVSIVKLNSRRPWHFLRNRSVNAFSSLSLD